MNRNELSLHFKLVKMDKVEVSNDNEYIIGTSSLATCVGFLVYSESKHIGIVGHVSDNLDKALEELEKLIVECELYNEKLKYIVVPGTYYNHYKIREYLSLYFRKHKDLFIPFDKIPKNAIRKDVIKEYHVSSNEFAFDTLSGKFITDKVLFGKEYYDLINSKKVYY